jgi:membrane protein
MHAVLEIVVGAARAFFADKAPKKSASLSFYTLFSLAPLVTVVLLIVGLLADEATARSAFATQLGALIGRDSAAAVLAVADASARERSGALASIAALLTTLVGATTVFAELKDSLDEIWDVPAVPRKGWWELVRARLLSFGLLLAVGFLLLVSLFVSTMLASVGTQVSSWLSGVAWIAETLNLAAALAAVTVLFAAIFKLLPNARLAWRDVWSGAALTAVLFTIGKTLIGLYLGATAATSAFGAAGSLVVVVVWVYYSAWILFYGAEITREFAQRHGTLRAGAPPDPAGPDVLRARDVNM